LGKPKLVIGGLVLGFRNFFETAQAASKNDARFKNGQN
jgi:hypothetical protein